MKTYQKFMTEKRGDTVVFTFGRFNPPTVGHKKLITAVESIAKTKGADFFIYPSHSQDSKKNPLNQTQKIKYMHQIFPKHAKNIKASRGKTALHIATELYDKKYTNLVMVVGSDRVQDFQRILDRYNGEDKAHGFYDFDSIEVVSAGERDPDAEGVEGMSASKMRAAAVAGDFKTFRMGVPSEADDKIVKKMFNDIRKAMRLEIVKEGKKWKEIDFTLEEQADIVTKLDKECEIEYKNYTTRYLHTSPVVYDIIDEMVNSVSGYTKKDEFYLKEALIVIDEFLQYRNESERTGKINQQDFFRVEQLGKKYLRFMENISISEHFDNSFIYKYISEVYENVQYEKVIDENIKKAIQFLMGKLKLTHAQANKIVQKASEKGIDLIKMQSRWSILAPTLMSLVADYDPREK